VVRILSGDPVRGRHFHGVYFHEKLSGVEVMPLLDDRTLQALRESQKRIDLCPGCTAQTWINYCRQCDEHFQDGHYEGCSSRSKHSDHRRY
jgi:predicted amidophosphoribosyltransferase